MKRICILVALVGILLAPSLLFASNSNRTVTVSVYNMPCGRDFNIRLQGGGLIMQHIATEPLRPSSTIPTAGIASANKNYTLALGREGCEQGGINLVATFNLIGAEAGQEVIFDAILPPGAYGNIVLDGAQSNISGRNSAYFMIN